MAIFNLYSKRRKAERGDVPEVYIYDKFPQAFKVQVVHIMRSALGEGIQRQNPHDVYTQMAKILCREYGIFELPATQQYSHSTAEYNFQESFLIEKDAEKLLDYIELCFRAIDKFTREYGFLGRDRADEIATNCIDELNARFKEHGLGYQFVDGDILRVDSEIIHSEVVKPALRLLQNAKYKGAEDEYLSAYEHYRHGRHKEAINDALKSFESMMKSICEANRWDYPDGAPAKKLIGICLDNNLIPQYWQQNFISLGALLETSVPVGRNKVSGHGQGVMPKEVPNHLTAYILHMTAAALVFLADAENEIL